MNLRDSLRKRRAAPVSRLPVLPGPDWVQPWWLARQRDHESAAYHPSGGVAVNAVGRSWTLVGNLDSVHRRAVDRRGLIAVRPGAWSLDWWIRAEEDWIFPSQASGVRQRLVDGAPVVETIVRAAGGDIVQRVYAARLDAEFLVVEVENQASGPIALALAVRPYDLQGGGRVDAIERTGAALRVDGEPAVIFGRQPGDLVTGAGGVDPASLLDDELAATSSVTCEEGRAAAAAVVPLVHGATLRVALPLEKAPDAADEALVARLPSAEQVARGWGRHAVNACRVVLPAGRVSEAFDATRQSLLLTQVRDDVDPAPYGPPLAPGDDAMVLEAMSELGYHGSVRDVLIARARSQDALGAVWSDGADVTASTLLATERALQLQPDAALATALSEVVADAARWLLEHREMAMAPEGLAAAARLLTLVDAPGAAAELDAIRPRLSASPPAHQPTTAGLIEDRVGPLGFDVVSTARLAFDEAHHDPVAAYRRIEAIVGVASPAWSWPAFTHPHLGTGTGGAGHDLRVTALLARALRRLLVDDSDADQLRLCGYWPPAWLGQGVEVHSIPSRHGPVSWAVRWHADRPALLWEIEGGAIDLVVTAPGLDPAWSGRGPGGEALLAAVELPEPDVVLPDGETTDRQNGPSAGSFG